MKVFKAIAMWLMMILSIPLIMLSAFGITWYALPTTKETIFGKLILKNITEKTIFWVFLASVILTVVFTILLIIFNRNQRSKVKNFFIHFNTWSYCLVSALLAVTTFVLLNPITTEGITIGIPKKIMIGIDMVVLVLFHIFAGKLNRIINRKIQAYDNAKELSVVGRSSIIWVNLLKVIELIFPEVLVLVLLCLMMSWDVAGYFTIILIATVIPLIGNIICDFNVRKEIVKNNEAQHQKLVNDVANNLKGKK